MGKVKLTLAFFLTFFVLAQGNSYSHSGKLDANGCHTNKLTGEYHCHQQQVDKSKAKFSTKQQTIRIVSVSDGDTVKAIMNGQQVRIRLYGIDAPESKQAFGQVAKSQLMSLTKGRAITMQMMDKDQYGRLVALLYAGGACLNEEMVKAGMAWIYAQYCKEPYRSQWSRHEAAAQKAQKGLWRDKRPTPPWQWRKESSAKKSSPRWW